jgi:hypothetical protein
MNPLIHLKRATSVFLATLVLACFAISGSAQAAQPPGIQDVNVFNTPFQHVFFEQLPPGMFTVSPSVEIPAGKTLVVEYVSADVRLPAGEQPVTLQFASRRPVEGRGRIVSLFLNFQASTNDRDFFVGSQQIRLYVSPGQDLSMEFTRDVSAGTATIIATVIGYLVNTP